MGRTDKKFGRQAALTGPRSGEVKQGLVNVQTCDEVAPARPHEGTGAWTAADVGNAQAVIISNVQYIFDCFIEISKSLKS